SPLLLLVAIPVGRPARGPSGPVPAGRGGGPWALRAGRVAGGRDARIVALLSREAGPLRGDVPRRRAHDQGARALRAEIELPGRVLRHTRGKEERKRCPLGARPIREDFDLFGEQEQVDRLFDAVG